MPPLVKRLLSEPLTQFAAIGLVVFALDRLTAEEPIDPRLIRIDETVQRELSGLFEQSRERLPTRAEMDDLIERYLIDETLYREARALRLDEGDQMIRARVMQRMRLMLYSGIQVEDPTEDALRAWYTARQDQFTKPAAISFRVIGLDAEPAEAAAVAARLQATLDAGEEPDLAGMPNLSFSERPRSQIAKLFDKAFVAAVEASEIGAWTPVPSPRGWQVVQYRGSTDAAFPAFDAIRPSVLAKWREDRKQIEARAALEALRRSYPVERLPYAAGVIAEGEGEAAPRSALTQ